MDIDLSTLKLLESEKNIDFDVLVDTIETALALAYQKTPYSMPKARAEINRKTGHVTIWAREEER
ncbi:MAG: transcription termination/antitermination protein NusA, partial [Cellulomonadaceae bacterium]|nr:transcription termination/antitermination protein NusA [Cellulomonadaceae bacterium]